MIRVLTIAQFWGSGFFHATVEQLTRLAPYIPFLQRNPRIKLHVDSKTGFLVEILKLVGLNPDRIVQGHIRAKVKIFLKRKIKLKDISLFLLHH